MNKKYNFKTLIDISQKLENDVIAYPGIKPLKVSFNRSYKKGHGMTESEILCNNHLGTHIDSPYHFFPDGKKVSQIKLDTFCGDAQVIKIPEEYDSITAEYIAKKDIVSKRILFKTKNSSLYDTKGFASNYTYISECAAKYLSERGVILVGLDYFCVDKYKDKKRTSHRALLGSDIAILEGINLSNVDEGIFFLVCLPLSIPKTEASLCRAVLLKN